jgi:hypothetical protein
VRVLALREFEAGRAGAPATWDREPPLLRDLHAALATAPRSLVGRGLADRLEPWAAGSYAGFFDRQTDVRLDASLVGSTRGTSRRSGAPSPRTPSPPPRTSGARCAGWAGAGC